jgi:hypothetical protein
MKIEQMLKLVSDMERFSPRGDQLSELVEACENELGENELELVAAAGRKPDFRDLLNRKK